MAHRDGPDSTAADGTEGAPGPIRAAARRVEVPPAAAPGRVDGPLVVWRSPGGRTLVGVGATARLTADGPDRFATIRDGADAIAGRLAYDGPESGRPRFLGGFAFDDGAPTAPWEAFPAASFVLPRLLFSRTAGECWLTAAVPVGGDGPAPEGLLDGAVDRLCEPAREPAGPAGEWADSSTDHDGRGAGIGGSGAPDAAASDDHAREPQSGSATRPDGSRALRSSVGESGRAGGPGDADGELATGAVGADRAGAARSTADRTGPAGTDHDGADLDDPEDIGVEDGGTAPGEALAVDGVLETVDRPDRRTWEAGVRAAVERIEAGDLRKVVLASSLRATLADPFDLAATLERLDEAYPDCYRFAVRPAGGATFFGATPELLAERRGGTVRTTALAGSAGRGVDPDADSALARDLADSEKRRREHDLVLEAVRDQLAPHAASIAIGDRRVRKLQRVQHLETPIEATLSGDPHVLDVVAALHPTPAVGGLPPAVARRVIAETERFDRGWYAGPVGWFDATGDGSFAVGIRSAVADGRSARLFAGSGIVADSDPAAEWAELQLKYHPVLEHLG